AAATVAVHSPALALLSNRDGKVVRGGRDWRERIVTEVSTPVRWDLCMQTMAGLGVAALIELPPAGTLTGLARRALPGVQTLALKGPGDLGAARELLAAHAAMADGGADDLHPHSHAPDRRPAGAPPSPDVPAG